MFQFIPLHAAFMGARDALFHTMISTPSKTDQYITAINKAFHILRSKYCIVHEKATSGNMLLE
jgi:hypothetical protein